MRRVRFALFALAVLLTACNPALPPAQNYATVTGRVFDVATSAPVAGAVITVSTVLVATSGADGTYRIPNVPVGQNEVQVRPPAGYTATPDQYPIAPQPGETVVVNIPLTKS
jgi:Carboxypeptidase regulatory-like domain